MALLPEDMEQYLSKNAQFIITTLYTVIASYDGQKKGYLVDVIRPDRVRNTIGCGDSFQAGYIGAFLRGRNIPDCVHLGMRVARQVVQANEAYLTGAFAE